MVGTPTLRSVVSAMLDLVPRGLDIAAGGPAAVAKAFRGLQVVALAPGPVFTNEHCECDGWYDRHFDPAHPTIYYRPDVVPARVAFTLGHEVGHHLVWSVAPELLEAIDGLAGPRGDPGEAEERACSELAGRVLIPDELVDRVVGPGPLRPGHVGELVERSGASWRAVSVRLADRLPGPGAVVLIREAGNVAFAAPSPGLPERWPAGSLVDPSGPLARALTSRARAAPDTYRFGLTYERDLWCDIEPVDTALAVAVLSWQPSDGRLNLLDEAKTEWRERPDCERCGEPRTEGWCDRCRGPFCPACGACGCYRPAKQRLCPQCGLLKGPGCFQPGDPVCNDCR